MPALVADTGGAGCLGLPQAYRGTSAASAHARSRRDDGTILDHNVHRAERCDVVNRIAPDSD